MASKNWQLAKSAAEKYDFVLVPNILGPFARQIVDHANPQVGQVILDVGCGTGAAALHAAGVSKDDGRSAAIDTRVTAIDINSGMLEVARVRSKEQGKRIDWCRADVCRLPLPPESVDLAVCAQTLQFVPDRLAALTNVARVLKPGGTLALSLWCALDSNPYFEALVDAIAEHIGTDVAGGLRAAFSLSDVDHVHHLVAEAGLECETSRVAELELQLPEITEFVPQHIGATPMAAGYEAASRQAQLSTVEDVARRCPSSKATFRSYMIIGRR